MESDRFSPDGESSHDLEAFVASVAISHFIFAFIMLASLMLLRTRQMLGGQAFLKGVMPAVLGAILVATVPLAQAALTQDHNGLLERAMMQLKSLKIELYVGAEQWSKLSVVNH